jgi:hypothetical protein
MAHPEPEVGLVISYSYLWSDASWVVLEDVNVFTWPGYDLRQIPGQAGRYDYGLLPPRFFESIIKRFVELRKGGQIVETSRDDEA